MDSKVLMKHNDLVNAKYESKLVHNRVFVYLLYAFQKYTDGDRLIHEVSREDLCKLVLKQNERTIKGLRIMLSDLRKKELFLVNENDDGSIDYITAGFIDKFSYNDKTDKFTITADAHVHRLLHRYLKDGYTPINLEIWMSLKNSYAQRFYDLLRSWSGSKRTINYTLDYIRKVMLLENKYKVYADFKKRVLLPAIEELNSTGFFEIEFEEKRVGRTIHSIDFIVKDLDKRVYFDKKESKKIIELEQRESTAIPDDSNSRKKISDDFYIPNKKLFTAKTLENFKADFKSYDFKDSTYKKLLQEAILATLEKDDEEKIKVKSYNYFKKTLENKLNDYFENQSKKVNNSKNETVYKKTKFHNFDETFTQYESNELNKIIEKSQDEKFRDRDDKNNSENFEHHAYNKCVEFNWDMSIKTVQISYQQAIKYAMEKGLYYPKNINELK